jgi:hypothetical protein
MSKKSTATAMTEDTEPTSEAPAAFVWLDYRGRQGPDQEFEHDGEMMIMAAAVPFTLAPGLNKIESATFEAARSVDDVAQLLAGKSPHLVETDADLSGYETTSNLRDLIERTQSGDALEHIQRLELAKPQTGRAGERRNPELIELLERGLARASRRRPLNLAGLHVIADRTAEAMRKSPQRRFAEAERANS